MEWLRERFSSCSCGLSPCSFGKDHKQPKRADHLPRPPTYADLTARDETDRSLQVLQVEAIDPDIVKNGIEHHTKAFELMRREDVMPELVIRRGQPFTIKIKCSRAYSEQEDGISFIFTVTDADKPNYGQGTLIAFPLLSKHEDNKTTWKAIVESSNENVLTVQITPSVDCVVGKWTMEMDTKLLKTGNAVSFKYPGPIYVLFNPWCKDDSVYIEGDDKRKEYVILDTGLIWRGSHKRLQPSVWKFAQYEKDILDCSLYLVNVIGKVPFSSSNNPVVIARALSAAVSLSILQDNLRQ